MQPLTLALVRQRYIPDGGAERFTERAIQTLQAQGVSITLITRAWRAQQDVTVELCNPFYIGSLWRDWGFFRAVRRLLQKRRFDLVQSHERTPGCDIYRAGDGVHREWLKHRRRAMGAFGRLRLMLNPYHYYMCRAERKLFNSSRLRAVICNSHMVKEEVKRWFGLPEEKLHVIYNGVDGAAFCPDLRRHRADMRARYAIPDYATLFLFVGSGFERKGMSILLKALAQLPDSAYLLVVGKDKKMKNFMAQAERLGLRDRVHFAGVQQDVKPFYGAADALVLPTLYDPFPNVVLEGLSAGLPVVTSTKCGAAELVEKNNCGFVCDALNTSALEEAMRALLVPTRRAELAAAARRAVGGLSPHALGEQLLKLYEDLSARPCT